MVAGAGHGLEVGGAGQGWCRRVIPVAGTPLRRSDALATARRWPTHRKVSRLFEQQLRHSVVELFLQRAVPRQAEANLSGDQAFRNRITDLHHRGRLNLQ